MLVMKVAQQGTHRKILTPFPYLHCCVSLLSSCMRLKWLSVEDKMELVVMCSTAAGVAMAGLGESYYSVKMFCHAEMNVHSLMANSKLKTH